MPYENLQKLEVEVGNDMFPCILPDEKLLLEKDAKPRVGDVIVFTNRMGLPIAHRLIHERLGLYYTRGDNCPFLNLPCTRSEIRGVVQGKHREVGSSRAASTALDMHSIYFRLSGFMKRSRCLPLDMISRFFLPIEAIEYMAGYDNQPINRVIFDSDQEFKSNLSYYTKKAIDNNIILNCPLLFESKDRIVYLTKLAQRQILLAESEKVTKMLEKDGIRYVILKGSSYPYERDMADIDILVADERKTGESLQSRGYEKADDSILETVYAKKAGKIDINIDVHKKPPSIAYNIDYPLKKKFRYDDLERLTLACTHTYQQGHITLRDLMDVRHLLEKVDVSSIQLGRQGVYQLMGPPLIILHLFMKRYDKEDEVLRMFCEQNYGAQLEPIMDYLRDRDYSMPVDYLHLYNSTKTFRIHGFLDHPREYTGESLKYFPFNTLIWIYVKVKSMILQRIILKKR
ncbi:nucleotidyltransferase family protein [Candidatus Altiarchaeota archaeon]